MFRSHESAASNVVRRQANAGAVPLLLFHYRVPAGGTAEFHLDAVPGYAVGMLRAGAMRHTWIDGGRERRIDRRVGQMILLEPRSTPQLMRWQVTEPLEWTSVWFTVDGLEAMAHAEGMRGGRPPKTEFLVDDPWLAAHLTKLFSPHLADDMLAAEQRVSDLTLALLARGGYRRGDRPADRAMLSATEKGRLLGVIDAASGRGPSLDALASAIGVSRSHLVRKFRRSFGVSPARYVMTRRIQDAIRAFDDPDTNLAALASDLGFSSQSHFTRVFHAYTGRTPGAFQREVRPAAGRRSAVRAAGRRWE